LGECLQADKGKLYFIQLNDGSIPLDIQADFLLYCCVYVVRLLGYVGLLLWKEKDDMDEYYTR
jgi:hypothetical protein